MMKVWVVDPDAEQTDEVIAAAKAAGATAVIDRIPPRYAGQVADDVRGYVELVEPDIEPVVVDDPPASPDVAPLVATLVPLAESLTAIPGTSAIAQKLRAAGASLSAAIDALAQT